MNTNVSNFLTENSKIQSIFNEIIDAIDKNQSKSAKTEVILLKLEKKLQELESLMK